MARSDMLHPGDIVEYCGKLCSVIQTHRDSSVITVQFEEPKPNVAYIYANKCNRAHLRMVEHGTAQV